MSIALCNRSNRRLRAEAALRDVPVIGTTDRGTVAVFDGDVFLLSGRAEKLALCLVARGALGLAERSGTGRVGIAAWCRDSRAPDRRRGPDVRGQVLQIGRLAGQAREPTPRTGSSERFSKRTVEGGRAVGDPGPDAFSSSWRIPGT